VSLAQNFSPKQAMLSRVSAGARDIDGPASTAVTYFRCVESSNAAPYSLAYLHGSDRKRSLAVSANLSVPSRLPFLQEQ
jgi:hypothetical protein